MNKASLLQGALLGLGVSIGSSIGLFLGLKDNHPQPQTNQQTNMSLPSFSKANIESTKGRQPSKYDSWLSEFKQPGDSLQFSEYDEDLNPNGLKRIQASSIARRFSELTGKKFHSFFDVKERKVTIRLRHPNELGGDNGESDNSPEVDPNDEEEESSDIDLE